MTETFLTSRVAVRPVESRDIPLLVPLLNAIIRAGGTTAYEQPFDETDFARTFVDGADVLLCFVAETDGRIAGFQALSRHPKLPEGWGDIATFVRQPGGKGIGRALFEATRPAADALGLVAINAAIRADNRSGLGFYDRCGFRDYRVDVRVPLADGTPVDRIFKLYRLRGFHAG